MKQGSGQEYSNYFTNFLMELQHRFTFDHQATSHMQPSSAYDASLFVLGLTVSAARKENQHHYIYSTLKRQK